MAPIQESVFVEISVGSPIVIGTIMTVVAATVLASLLLVVFVCACGKKNKGDPATMLEEPPPTSAEAPKNEMMMAPSPIEPKPADEDQPSTKTAKQASVSIRPAVMPSLKLQSQKGNDQFGNLRIPNQDDQPMAKSLKLTNMSSVTTSNPNRSVPSVTMVPSERSMSSVTMVPSERSKPSDRSISVNPGRSMAVSM